MLRHRIDLQIYIFGRMQLAEHHGWQVDAQVMLLLNLDMTGPAEQMLVNGSRGVVVGFISKAVRTKYNVMQ